MTDMELLTSINQNPNINFTSRSVEIKKTGDICRRVINEFPIVYSDTRLSKFSTSNKCKSFNRLANYTSALVDKYRDYYSVSNLCKLYKRKILGLKKHKTGNCGEITDATYMALKINGYEDVKPLWLYAYTPNKKVLRDLDHAVVGINFRTPSDYKYKKGEPVFMHAKYALKPQKDSIIVDSWAGFSEYGKNLSGKNGCVYDRKDLLHGLTNDKKAKSLLKKGEELCFVPIEPEERMPDDMISMFKELFPQLSLSEKFGTPDTEKLKLELEGSGIKISEIRRLKKVYRLKASNPQPTIFEKLKEKVKKIV